MNRNQGNLIVFSDISSNDRQRLNFVESWSLTSIRKRVAREMDWSVEFSRLVETEYRKFIFLASIRPQISYGMAGPVDQFWHQHVLDTQDYLAMCQRVAGRVIHHIPVDSKSNTLSADNSYSKTLSDLNCFFGTLAQELWPSDNEACRACLGCRAVIEQDHLDRRIAY
jgi:hypothetical protein